MATYVIGDVQGCFDSLQALLKMLNFRPKQDSLWFAGDLVNRGPKSLETLRFICDLPRCKVVLGNHDLHLLALASGVSYKGHTLDTILESSDSAVMMEWLRKWPLVHFDPEWNVLMVHAGIAPEWTLSQTLSLAEEVAAILSSAKWQDMLQNMYGDMPNCWQDSLQGWERYRCLLSIFTRMRYCTLAGELDFKETGALAQAPSGLEPWFSRPHAHGNVEILFGHWASLQANIDYPGFKALDGGCVWGKDLVAYCLDTKAWVRCPAVERRLDSC
jgi:bis(5'-nucleosyl)-tetraphosphatase (symmetrical)